MLKIFLLTILTLALILPHSCLVESNENGRCKYKYDYKYNYREIIDINLID